MNKKYRILFLIFLTILIPILSFAAPVLNFSDTDAGPRTGNGDTYCNSTSCGAIVTIWGHNLGNSKGTNKVYVGNVEATQVYYWKDADGSLPGSPAVLNAYRSMQEIAFAVPSGALTGSNTIKVNVDGVDSNTLPFYVNTGRVRFVKQSGNDSTGDGSWATPWKTMSGAMDGNHAIAGDLVYSVDVTSTSGVKMAGSAGLVGTATMPYMLSMYPGNNRITVSGLGSNLNSVIENWYPSSRKSAYNYISKLSITCAGNDPGGGSPNGVFVGLYPRVIGTKITGPSVYKSSGGAITASSGGNNYLATTAGAFLGNYIHDYGYQSTTPGLNNYSYTYSDDANDWTTVTPNNVGDLCTNCTSQDSQIHTFYVSCRDGITTDRCLPHEIGWNYLLNNAVLHGIHLYDIYGGGTFYGDWKIHHNVVKNQRGGAIDISLPNTVTGQTNNVNIYDNLIIYDSNTKFQGIPFRIVPNSQNTIIYNNTVYGWHNPSYFESQGGDILRNNIFYDTVGVTYVHSAGPPTTKSNNAFFSDFSTALPSWYSTGSGDKNVDPKFTVKGSNFSLQATSPLLTGGYGSTPSLITGSTDLNGNSQGTIGYGAFLQASGSTPTYTVGGTLSGLSSGNVVIQNNTTNDTTLSANGVYTFSTQIASGSTYSVTIKTQPTGQTCTVSNGSGTISGTVTNVNISCVDSQIPVISTFTINPITQYALTVTGISMNGSDNVGITGYCLQTTNTSTGCVWSGTKPTSYTFTSSGAKTLYAFFKDAAGNISNSSSVNVTIILVSASCTGCQITGGSMTGR